MKVTLNISDSYALYFGLSSIEKQFKLFTALILVKQGKISVSKGAELSELTIYDFLRECKQNDIPVIDYSKEELKEEGIN
jgi:predicted HTH domain antitoxin